MVLTKPCPTALAELVSTLMLRAIGKEQSFAYASQASIDFPWPSSRYLRIQPEKEFTLLYMSGGRLIMESSAQTYGFIHCFDSFLKA